ncbi:hypothetical protein HDU97_008256 [Phlyctochytrium planicorne]|nr:hypothetical protein HDU97_008256 [Phlyctochytrium planicorne]
MAYRFRQKFKNTLKQEPFPDNSYAMTVPSMRNDKQEPQYERPYKVLRRTCGGSYQLLDADGTVLPWGYSPSQLKLVSGDPWRAEDVNQVQAILDHCRRSNQQEYLVRWKGYSADADSCVPFKDFQEVDIVCGTSQKRKIRGEVELTEQGKWEAEPVKTALDRLGLTGSNEVSASRSISDV